MALGYSPEHAAKEANRCIQCKKPKCVEGCPVGVEIPAFIRALRDGDLDEAVRSLKGKNSLPGICGRVCPQEVQCEARCVLAKKGAPVAIGPLDVSRLAFAGTTLTRNQGYYYFVWIAVLVLGLAARNILRTRPGRALQAIRDRDLAAEVIGVSLVQYKVGAFVLSSGYAACAGAMYASYSRYVSPLDFTLFLSIQYVAMIVVGGVGSVMGSIFGALFLTALPRLIESVSGSLPFVVQQGGIDGVS